MGIVDFQFLFEDVMANFVEVDNLYHINTLTMYLINT